jgi:histidyl-tRNA synthetase
VPQDQPLIDRLPHSVDYLCDDCRQHFGAVERHLAMYGIPYRVSHRLVRGLDYYTRTTFEILAGNIGAQNAILGGGRYDGLVKQLGGPDRVGIGFAAGIERLVLAMPDAAGDGGRRPLFVAAMGESARESALALLRDLRRAGLEAHMEYEGRSIKSQMKRADRLKAAFALILGDDELASGVVSVKNMSTGEQTRVSREAAVDHCRALAAGGQE